MPNKQQAQKQQAQTPAPPAAAPAANTWLNSQVAGNTSRRLAAKLIAAYPSATLGSARAAKVVLTSAPTTATHTSVAAMHLACVAGGVPVSRMVRAFGADRQLNPALNANWQVVWWAGKRYLPFGAAQVPAMLAQLAAMA